MLTIEQYRNTIGIKAILSIIKKREYFVFAAFLLLWGDILLHWTLRCLSAGISADNLLSPKHSFYFQPTLSKLFATLILELFGQNGTIITACLLLPLASFSLLILIFKRHVSIWWAATLALLAVSSIGGYPFRDFLSQIIVGAQNSAGTPLLPALLYFPIPSFSTLYFLLIFYTAVRPYLGVPAITLLSAACALMIYINALDAPFVLAIWCGYFPLKLLRQKCLPQKLLTVCLLQAIVIGMFIIPAIINADFSVVPPPSSDIGLYYCVVYLILPIFLILLLYFLYHFDPYELLFRFRHVYFIMSVEILLLCISSTGIIQLDMHIMKNRIVQFFAHTFYYIPIIYFASKTNNYISYTENSIIAILQKIIYGFFHKYSIFLISILSILLYTYNISASNAYNFK
jgi:hypothetical protein